MIIRLHLTPELLRFYDHLHAQSREQLGRISHDMLWKYASTGRLWTVLENGDPAGYVIANDTTRSNRKTRYPAQLRIYVACIDYTARRREIGTALVHAVIAHHANRDIDAVGLWCAEDIEANEFWKSLAFTPGPTRPGGRKRRRTLVEYRMALHPKTTRTLFPTPGPT